MFVKLLSSAFDYSEGSTIGFATFLCSFQIHLVFSSCVIKCSVLLCPFSYFVRL